MQLHRLYIENFLAVGKDPVEIIFSSVGGITLIKGNNQDISGKSSNGSGKSTIIEAIFFGLTGSTLRKLNLEGILHNRKSGECRVEIEFDNVKIIRTISPKGKGGCEFFVDGVPCKAASIKETNKLVDEKVGINFETLSNILIFGQHNIVSFLEAGEGEKREIIENLMNLREYNQYEENAKELLKQAKSSLKTLADKHGVHSKYLQEQLTLLEKQKSVLSDYRTRLNNEITDLDAKIVAMPDIEQLRDLWRNYMSYMDARNKLESHIHALVEKRNQLQSEYNSAVANKQKDSQGKQPLIDRLNQVKAKSTVLEERKRQLWQEKVVPLGIEIERNEGIIANFRCEIARQIDSIRPDESFDWQKTNVEKQIKQQQDRIKHLQSHGVKDGETCPTCYGQVDSSNLRNLVGVIEGEISQLETQLSGLRQQAEAEANRVNQERAKLQKQLEKTEGESQIQIADLTAKMKEAEEQVKIQYFGAKEKLDSLVQTAQNDVDNFDIELNQKHDPIIESKETSVTHTVGELAIAQSSLKRLTPVEQPSTAVEEIGKLQAQLETFKKEKTEKLALIDNNPYLDMISTLESSITKIQTDIDGVDAEIKSVEAKMPYHQFWVDHMGKEGIKSFVIDQIIPTLNQQIDYWMQLIYQGAITVKFDKYFNVSMVNNASKNEMIFGQGSGGERRRIDIAIMLAFRQIMKMSTGKDPNILFFDEVAENLDEEGVYRLFDAMQDIAKTSHLYVITHNPTLLHLLQNSQVINVVKKDGAMRLAA